MTRRTFLSRLAVSAPGAAAWLALPRVLRAGDDSPPIEGGEAVAPVLRLQKSRDQWRDILDADRYNILFAEGTEAPHSSALNNEKRVGLFVCAACNLPLFDSATKYESGTGWPSFFSAIEGRVATKADYKLIWPRTEYHCARCGGHQGHIFSDGPKPTGKRYCNNGLALNFAPQGEPLPKLRT